VFDIMGLADAVQRGVSGGNTLRVRAKAPDGRSSEFDVSVRIDTPQEFLYYRHGGILQYVLRQLLSGKELPEALSQGMAATAQPGTEHKSSDGVVEEGSIQSFPASDPPSY